MATGMEAGEVVARLWPGLYVTPRRNSLAQLPAKFAREVDTEATRACKRHAAAIRTVLLLPLHSALAGHPLSLVVLVEEQQVWGGEKAKHTVFFSLITYIYIYTLQVRNPDTPSHARAFLSF